MESSDEDDELCGYLKTVGITQQNNFKTRLVSLETWTNQVDGPDFNIAIDANPISKTTVKSTETLKNQRKSSDYRTKTPSISSENACIQIIDDDPVTQTTVTVTETVTNQCESLEYVNRTSPVNSENASNHINKDDPVLKQSVTSTETVANKGKDSNHINKKQWVSSENRSQQIIKYDHFPTTTFIATETVINQGESPNMNRTPSCNSENSFKRIIDNDPYLKTTVTSTETMTNQVIGTDFIDKTPLVSFENGYKQTSGDDEISVHPQKSTCSETGCSQEASLSTQSKCNDEIRVALCKKLSNAPSECNENKLKCGANTSTLSGNRYYLIDEKDWLIISKAIAGNFKDDEFTALKSRVASSAVENVSKSKDSMAFISSEESDTTGSIDGNLSDTENSENLTSLCKTDNYEQSAQGEAELGLENLPSINSCQFNETTCHELPSDQTMATEKLPDNIHVQKTTKSVSNTCTEKKRIKRFTQKPTEGKVEVVRVSLENGKLVHKLEKTYFQPLDDDNSIPKEQCNIEKLPEDHPAKKGGRFVRTGDKIVFHRYDNFSGNSPLQDNPKNINSTESLETNENLPCTSDFDNGQLFAFPISEKGELCKAGEIVAFRIKQPSDLILDSVAQDSSKVESGAGTPGKKSLSNRRKTNSKLHEDSKTDQCHTGNENKNDSCINKSSPRKRKKNNEAKGKVEDLSESGKSACAEKSKTKVCRKNKRNSKAKSNATRDGKKCSDSSSDKVKKVDITESKSYKNDEVNDVNELGMKISSKKLHLSHNKDNPEKVNICDESNLQVSEKQPRKRKTLPAPNAVKKTKVCQGERDKNQFTKTAVNKEAKSKKSTCSGQRKKTRKKGASAKLGGKKQMVKCSDKETVKPKKRKLKTELVQTKDISVVKEKENAEVNEDVHLPFKKRKLKFDKDADKTAESPMKENTNQDMVTILPDKLRNNEINQPHCQIRRRKNNCEDRSTQKVGKKSGRSKSVKLKADEEFVPKTNENNFKEIHDNTVESTKHTKKVVISQVPDENVEKQIKKQDNRRKKSPRKKVTLVENKPLKSKRVDKRSKGRRKKTETDDSWKEFLSEDEHGVDINQLEKSPAKQINIRKVIKSILKPEKKKSSSEQKDAERSDNKVCDGEIDNKKRNTQKRTIRKASEEAAELADKILTSLKQRNSDGIHKMKEAHKQQKKDTSEVERPLEENIMLKEFSGTHLTGKNTSKVLANGDSENTETILDLHVECSETSFVQQKDKTSTSNKALFHDSPMVNTTSNLKKTETVPVKEMIKRSKNSQAKSVLLKLSPNKTSNTASSNSITQEPSSSSVKKIVSEPILDSVEKLKAMLDKAMAVRNLKFELS